MELGFALARGEVIFLISERALHNILYLSQEAVAKGPIRRDHCSILCENYVAFCQYSASGKKINISVRHTGRLSLPLVNKDL